MGSSQTKQGNRRYSLVYQLPIHEFGNVSDPTYISEGELERYAIPALEPEREPVRYAIPALEPEREAVRHAPVVADVRPEYVPPSQLHIRQPPIVFEELHESPRSDVGQFAQELSLPHRGTRGALESYMNHK